MNQEQPKVVVSNGKPKDPVTECFERMKDFALLSPILAAKATKDIDLVNFSQKISINNLYWIVIGITVNFYEHPLFGSFYPNWIVQSAYFSKDKKLPVKLKWLTGKQRTELVEYHHKAFKVLSSWERGEIKQYRSINRTAESLEWRVPFSEDDTMLLDVAFQNLIRRSGNGNAKTNNHD